jgi:carboxypeptidase Taq
MTRIPETLAVEIARAASEGQSVWEKARPKDDWVSFKPYLERLVDLKRAEAEALGYAYEPYDALLDGYEEGETATRLAPVMTDLASSLKRLLERIVGKGRPPRESVNGRRFPVGAQKEFAQTVAAKLGYDFQGGRLDESAHPFTSGIGPGDVRITARYSETHFNEGFFAVIHEAGHAMYHQGMPQDHWGEPFCRAASLGVHESQSRMWENMVARSRPFWEHFFPMARERFPCLWDSSMDSFVLEVNEVKPSLIRVEADEVTYNLHVLLRFELERALMRKDLTVDDLPEAWNAKMRDYLGVTPDNHKDGVMQDVHWSGGSIGYFPTYTLGNIYAAQLFETAQEELGDLARHFATGDFSVLLNWLRQRVHSQGARFQPRDLVRNITGRDLDPSPLVRYLESKYSQLYGF